MTLKFHGDVRRVSCDTRRIQEQEWVKKQASLHGPKQLEDIKPSQAGDTAGDTLTSAFDLLQRNKDQHQTVRTWR